MEEFVDKEYVRYLEKKLLEEMGIEKEFWGE